MTSDDCLRDETRRNTRLMEILYPDGVRPEQYEDMLLARSVLLRLRGVALGSEDTPEAWQAIEQLARVASTMRAPSQSSSSLHATGENPKEPAPTTDSDVSAEVAELVEFISCAAPAEESSSQSSSLHAPEDAAGPFDADLDRRVCVALATDPGGLTAAQISLRLKRKLAEVEPILRHMTQGNPRDATKKGARYFATHWLRTRLTGGTTLTSGPAEG